jgi:hypothetical protein
MSDAPVASQLAALFDAERASRRLHAEILRHAARDAEASAALTSALRREVDAASAQKDDAERALRLTRIAVLLGDLHGAATVDLLIDILASDEAEARHAAGEALEGLAYDRFKEVALGIERALTRLPGGSPALSELPYLLAEIPEPGATSLLARFLHHKDAEAVAAAIEALAEIGDPSAASLLEPLLKDKRVAQIDDEEGEEGKVTIGELATEARDLLAEIQRAHGRENRPR